MPTSEFLLSISSFWRKQREALTCWRPSKAPMCAELPFQGGKSLAGMWLCFPFNSSAWPDLGLGAAFSRRTSSGETGKDFEIAAGKRIPQNYHLPRVPLFLSRKSYLGIFWRLLFFFLHLSGHYHNHCLSEQKSEYFCSICIISLALPRASQLPILAPKVGGVPEVLYLAQVYRNWPCMWGLILPISIVDCRD